MQMDPPAPTSMQRSCWGVCLCGLCVQEELPTMCMLPLRNLLVGASLGPNEELQLRGISLTLWAVRWLAQRVCFLPIMSIYIYVYVCMYVCMYVCVSFFPQALKTFDWQGPFRREFDELKH